MFLKNIIDKFYDGKPLTIEYRTLHRNMLIGTAIYCNGRLESCDHDIYDLSDIVDKYDYSSDENLLTIWYESAWLGE